MKNYSFFCKIKSLSLNKMTPKYAVSGIKNCKKISLYA